MRILVANIPTSFAENEFLWSPTGKARGSQETPHKGRTSRTRGPIHPRVEPVVLLVRDRLNSNE
jgi:hypothetical protein